MKASAAPASRPSLRFLSGALNSCAAGSGSKVAQDRGGGLHFEKDKIFAYINLSDPELEVYNRYYQLPRAAARAGPGDLSQASPDVLKKRLRKKNVAGETAVSDDYIEEVVKAYEHFFFHYTSSDLLVVNTNDIDFVERHTDLQELLRA